MPEVNLTRQLIKAQEIDYVAQFGREFKSLLELLGIHETIPMRVGDTLNTYKSSVTLAGGTVEPGAIIPLSKVKMEKGEPILLEYDKRRKAVPAEDIQKFGFERAVRMTDEALLKELQKNIRKKLVDNLAKGTGAVSGTDLQGALAQGWGAVETAFEDDSVVTIAFVNTKDVADHLGQAQLIHQTLFGMKYLEGFLGVDVVFINALIPKGTAYVTAAKNLKVGFADVGGEMAKAFPFTKDNTGVIGILHDIQHERLTAETVTISGLAIFAEVLNGVVKATIEAPVVAP